MRAETIDTPTRDAVLAKFYELNGPWVYALLLRIVKNSRQAEELAIEVFWRAWRSDRLSALSARSVVMWLRVLARNVAIEFLQRNGFLMRHPANFAAAYLTTPSGFDLSTVASAAIALAPNEKEVFELAYFEGLSHTQISEIMGRSLGTVKTWARTSRLRVERIARSQRMITSTSVYNVVTVDNKLESPLCT